MFHIPQVSIRVHTGSPLFLDERTCVTLLGSHFPNPHANVSPLPGFIPLFNSQASSLVTLFLVEAAEREEGSPGAFAQHPALCNARRVIITTVVHLP